MRRGSSLFTREEREVYALISRHGERDKKEKLQREYIFMNISTDQEQ